MNSLSNELRTKVAREAANLLYFGIEKEYKQAKQKAAKTLGVKFLPTNLEVAKELDKLAEEIEGKARDERLIQRRKEALKLMKILRAYTPILVGSVWRGTAHHQSDIDIIVYNDEPKVIVKSLEQNSFNLVKTEWVGITEQGRKATSFHIYCESSNGEKFEVIVRSPEEAHRKAKCDIYGDEITGLSLQELEKLLKENPTQRFVP
ncbi:MAG: nucleotidyltransferase domain-containing protein [Candidatus Bathyarchaeia archaeon]